jgi:hypothetical protein
MARRLWATLVDTASADKAIKDSAEACFVISLICGAMLAYGLWRHDERTYPLAMFVVAYLLIGWRVRRGSAAAVEVGFYFFLVAVSFVISTHTLTSSSALRGWLPIVGFFMGMNLLNGVRAVSYLEAVGRDDSKLGDEPGPAGVPVRTGPRPTLPSMAESGD